jgi:hypothetical protein
MCKSDFRFVFNAVGYCCRYSTFQTKWTPPDRGVKRMYDPSRPWCKKNVRTGTTGRNDEYVGVVDK